MKKAKKSRVSQERLPDRSSELLINQRILSAVRDELKTDIRSHDQRFDSIDKRFDSIDKRFESIDARLEAIDKRFESIDAKLLSHDAQFQALDKKIDSVGDRLSADIQKISAAIHRVISLVEEQENRNRAVLDGYQSLYDRQERLEGRVDELTNTVLNIKKISQ